MSEAQKYWLAMRPEINRRFAESLAKIGENVAKYPSPLGAEKEAHEATKIKHATALQSISAIVSREARKATGVE